MFGIVFLSFSGNKIVSILLTIVVIAVNLYFVINQVEALSIEGGVLAVVCEYLYQNNGTCLHNHLF